MKTKLFLILSLILLLVVPSSYGASSQIFHRAQIGSLHEFTVEWTAHTDGSYTSYVLPYPIDGTVYCVVTDPGATAPQDNYDITLTDQYSRDIMGGALANRDTANTETAQPYISDSASYVAMPVRGHLTLAISGNNVNGATGKVIIYFFKD